MVVARKCGGVGGVGVSTFVSQALSFKAVCAAHKYVSLIRR